jgi:hypothetical protein
MRQKCNTLWTFPDYFSSSSNATSTWRILALIMSVAWTVLDSSRFLHYKPSRHLIPLCVRGYIIESRQKTTQSFTAQETSSKSVQSEHYLIRKKETDTYLKSCPRKYGRQKCKVWAANIRVIRCFNRVSYSLIRSCSSILPMFSSSLSRQQ